MGGWDVIVVGAGAAGLWAAARCAELSKRVILLEKTARTGTKVLASGGTRCNLTTSLPPEEAARLFGPRGGRFLRGAFRALPPLALRARFEELGVATVEAPLDKVFPASDRARDVRDALEGWARGRGVEIRTNAPVVALERAGALWRVRTADGGALEAALLVLASGGKSVPRSGTTGDGYPWLAQLGLPLVEAVPALVPLASPAPWVSELAGIALQDVEARLVDSAKRLLGRRARPVVFTHHGVSGPGAMDLSEPVARAAARTGGETLTLLLDLVPGVEREEIRAFLLEAAGASGAPRLALLIAQRFGERVPRRIAERALVQAGLFANARTSELAREKRHGLVEALKGLAVPVDGTLGWEKAEVTAGGLALEALDPGTMRVKGLPGLLVIGELLDLQGPIGGLNFQSAFATAEIAARACA